MTTCTHQTVEDVISDGLVVAKVCATCWEQLPSNWGCTDCEWIEEWRLCDPHPHITPGRRCAAHGTDHPLEVRQ